MKNLVKTDHSSTTILIRLMVGAVFLAEGIENFMFPRQQGTERLEKIGLAQAEMVTHFVGVFEILAGILILIGLFTRAGAFTTLVIMSIAIIFTKLPIAFGESFGPFGLNDLNTYGFWSMIHEIYTDWAMWLGSFFLLLKGGGRWSVDLSIYRKNYSFSWSE